MDHAFWLERWKQKQIGFHQSDVNTYLKAHWHTVAPAPEKTVLVPLCGKSRDMRWLQQQGHRVLGVELSEEAVAAFFTDAHQRPVIEPAGPFTRWSADGITILQGDFFALTAADAANCGAVFDRAALIALPPTMRAAYAAHLARVVPETARTLLITFSYQQSEMNGPPFSVDEQEVRTLYAPRSVEVLQTEDVLAANPGFVARGLSRATENVFRIGSGAAPVKSNSLHS